MLNELCQLADSLEKAGIAPKEWHPQLKQLPKVNDNKPCYKITISADGIIDGIEVLTIDLVSKLRKWEPSNGNSFPGFNIHPLYRITTDEQKKKLKQWKDGKDIIDIELLKTWLSEDTQNWDGKLSIKLKKCLREIPLNLSKFYETVDEADPIRILISRVIRLPHTAKPIGDSYNKGFQQALEEFLLDNISNGIETNVALSVLIHEGVSSKKPENDRGAISVFFDISDWKKYPVASCASMNTLNESLVAGSTDGTTVKDLDAFGNSIVGGDNKLPGVKLPFLAEVKLRAMNSESLCQYRYGTIDANSFPIGRESRKRAKGSLEWLGDESREGETWGRAESKEILFAYPSILPKVPIKLASCFGARKSNDSEARFANAAKDVIIGLSAIVNDLRNLELRVFSLRKMDKARTKIVFHRNYSAQRLVDAASDWQEGCGNVPNICIQMWGEEKGATRKADLEIPYPLDIARILNHVWKFDGKKNSLICDYTPILQPSCGIELLLEEDGRQKANSLLTMLLQNSKQLLLHLGDAITRNRVLMLNPISNENHKLLIPSTLGLLLYVLGIRKETYMAKIPFLVGRMLKLADELHALYCKEVRDNKLPPQLIGNTLMTAGLVSPTQALAQLALRLKPYYGWAQTCRSKENGGLAGYFIALLGEVSAELSKMDLPSRFNDAERAQLLLGYLASNPKRADKLSESMAPKNN